MSIIFKLVTQYWRQITVLTLALITVLSLTPLAHLPDAPGSDKTHHLIAYFALALPAAMHGGPKWLLLLPVYILWSGVIELIQPFVNRYGEWYDLVANSVGVGLGALAGEILRRIHR